MTDRKKILAAIAVLFAGLPFTAAEAQWYGGRNRPPPLYPYVVQGQPGYHPQGYVVQPYSVPRTFPYVRPSGDGGYFIYPAPAERVAPPKRIHRSKQVKVDPAPNPKPKAKRAKVAAPDPELIEELRKQTAGAKREKTVNKTTVVRGPPIIRETKKYVDDPPIVIERYHYVDDDEEPPLPKPRRKRAAETDDAPAKRGRNDESPRVIRADAEITIHGPDRMTIRLLRKGAGTGANARAE